VAEAAETVRIMGIAPDTVLRPPGSRTRLPAITLQAQGGRGGHYWLLNGDLIARTGVGEPRPYQFKRPGRHALTVMDMGGNYDSVRVMVLGTCGR
jgi:membrane carboxypeptidase/penicillin-binding protein PbpC